MEATYLIFKLDLTLDLSYLYTKFSINRIEIHRRGRNFYQIATKFGTQVHIVNSKVHFEGRLCGFFRDPQGSTTKNYI